VVIRRPERSASVGTSVQAARCRASPGRCGRSTAVPSVVGMSARTLRTILGDVPGANGYRYDAKDSAGNRMDTVKIIDNPAGG
jgi:hypothetical protein